MKKKGNLIQFDRAERKVLKSLVDKKYGKMTSSIDYESTYGLHDNGLEGDVFQKSGEIISGSTLERLVGLTRDRRKCTTQSLRIVSKYLDYSSVSNLLDYISRNTKKNSKEQEGFLLTSFVSKHFFRIHIGEDKVLIIKLLAENKFELVESINSVLEAKDLLFMGELELRKELELHKVMRSTAGKLESLGGYASGSNNPVTEISFIKPPGKQDEQDELLS